MFSTDLDDRVMIIADAAKELGVAHERLRCAVIQEKIETQYVAAGRPYLRFGDARDYVKRMRRRRRPSNT